MSHFAAMDAFGWVMFSIFVFAIVGVIRECFFPTRKEKAEKDAKARQEQASTLAFLEMVANTAKTAEKEGDGPENR